VWVGTGEENLKAIIHTYGTNKTRSNKYRLQSTSEPWSKMYIIPKEKHLTLSEPKQYEPILHDYVCTKKLIDTDT